MDSGFSVDKPGGRKIRARNDANQLFKAKSRIVDNGLDGINGFIQIVGRNIGCHAYCNAG